MRTNVFSISLLVSLLLFSLNPVSAQAETDTEQSEEGTGASSASEISDNENEEGSENGADGAEGLDSADGADSADGEGNEEAVEGADDDIQRFSGDEDGSGDIGEEESRQGVQGGTSKSGSSDAMGDLNENHMVQSGDTLWDLCAKYLNSPWYWPKIWSYNPQITNAHWIYPGNQIRFYPADADLPANVEAAQAVEVAANEEIPARASDSDLVKTVGRIEVGRIQPNSVVTVYNAFISDHEHAGSGEIVAAHTAALMLDDYDRLYVEFPQTPNPSSEYAIYRTTRRIEHPETGESLGWAVELIGRAVFIDTSGKLSRVDVKKAYRAIERGDFVGEWPEHFGKRVGPTPNPQAMDGYIVASGGDVMDSLGEHHLVFIDRGESDGIQPGNTFTIFRRGDEFLRRVDDLPEEAFGQLMVLNVQKKTATAMVTRSLREVKPGDHIRMLP